MDISETNLRATEQSVKFHMRCGIHWSSVSWIIHKDLRLKCCKKIRAQQLTEAHSMHALFLVCSLTDYNVITSKPMCLWIYLPNVITIDPYNFELYRFKVGSFFETQCIDLSLVFVVFWTARILQRNCCRHATITVTDLCPTKTCDYIFYNNFNNKCPITIIFSIVTQ